MAEAIYNPDRHPKQAELICAQTGATITQLGGIFEVDPKTVFGWRARYPEFARAVERGLDTFRRDVAEEGLEKRMRGYTYTESTFKVVDGEKVLVKEVTKDRPSDTEAIKFFLLNRCPERWGKDAQQTEVSGDSFKGLLDEVISANTEESIQKGANLFAVK